VAGASFVPAWPGGAVAVAVEAEAAGVQADGQEERAGVKHERARPARRTRSGQLG